MRLFVVMLAFAGCGSGDPCDGRGAVCISLTVDGTLSGIDQLAVTVDQPVTKKETTPTTSLSLPARLGLNLPSSVSGLVNIDVVALAKGAPIGEGTGQATVVNGRGKATVTLGAPGGDLAGLDLPPGVPGAPTNVVASGGNAQATITWSPPTDPGASPITSYVISSSGGGQMTTASTGITFTGLTNGTSYTFSVAAINAVGTGPAATSNPTTPTATPMAPSAPANVSAIANVDRGATVSWTAADNHGSPLTGYTITTTGVAGATANAGPTDTSAVVHGLTPGMLYTFVLTATNAIGTSDPSVPSNPITAATAPDSAPTSVTAIANLPGGATVSWTAPVSDGFSPITSYTVTPSPAGPAATTADGKTLSVPVMGLTAGTAYSFTVTASNLIGAGPASAPSSPVTVNNKAAAPTVSVCGSDGKIWISYGTVSGASSYNIYYSASSPASGGTKIANATSPQSISVVNGTYYVAVSAVTAVGEGNLSADQQVTPGSAVHDALFVSSGALATKIDIYDCFSVAQTSTPTRSITTTVETNYFSPIAVDGPGAILFVSDGSSIQIWTNAGTLSGSPAANYTLSVPNGPSSSVPLVEVAVDAVHHKLYAYGTTADIYRFGYTAAADLNGTPTPEATRAVTNTQALSADGVTGNLWSAESMTNSGAALFTNLATGPQLTLDPNPSWASVISGIAFDPGTGSVFISNSSKIAWYDSATIASNPAPPGFLPPDGSLAVAAGALSVGNGMLLTVVASSGKVEVWNTSSVSGSPSRTISTSIHSGWNAGLFYVP